MTVSIEYIINEDVIDVNDILGGIAVMIDGEPVARVVDQDGFESRYRWKPSYMGQYIQTDFHGLVEATTDLVGNSIDIYETTEVRFPPSRAYLLLEPLSTDSLRIAYRIRNPDRERAPDSSPIAAPESARGFVVSRYEFDQAVSTAAHDYLDDIRSMSPEWGLELIEDFDETVVELDTAIEEYRRGNS